MTVKIRFVAARPDKIGDQGPYTWKIDFSVVGLLPNNEVMRVTTTPRVGPDKITEPVQQRRKQPFDLPKAFLQEAEAEIAAGDSAR